MRPTPRPPRIEVPMGKVVVEYDNVRVLTLMAQGDPASSFNLSQIKDVNPATVPTPGHLLIGEAYGDGQQRWTNALLTPALVGADPAGSAATAQTNAQNFATSADTTLLATANSMALGYANTAQTNAQDFATAADATVLSTAQGYATAAQTAAQTFATSADATVASNAAAALAAGLALKADASHTHSAADITTGSLALSRGGTNADLTGAGSLSPSTSAKTSAGVLAIAPGDLVSARQLTIQEDIAADIPGLSYLGTVAGLPSGYDIVSLKGYGGYVFACDRVNNNVYSFSQSLGVLTLISTLSLGSGTTPCNMAVDPSGAFLYVLNNAAGTIQSVSVAAGILSLNGTAVSTSGTLPQAIAIDPSGAYLYVGSGIAGAGVIQTFPLTSGTIGAASSSIAAPYPYAIACKSGFLFAVASGAVGTGCNVQPYTITAGVLSAGTAVAANVGGASCIAISAAGDKLVVGGGATSQLPALGDDRVRYRQITVSLLTLVGGVPTWRSNATAIYGNYGPVGITFDSSGANAYTTGINGCVRFSISGNSIFAGGVSRGFSISYGDSYYFGAIWADASGYIYAGSQLVTLIHSNKSPIVNLPAAIGGTGGYSAADARFTMGLPNFTTVGDIGYCAQSGTVGVAARLAGNITTTKQFLSQTGTGTISSAPAWSALAAADIPNLDAAKITTGSLALAQMPAAGTSGQFLRGDKTWSNTIVGFVQAYGLNLDTAGTGVANSRQIVGHTTVGNIYNAPAGMGHELRINGAANLQVNSGQVIICATGTTDIGSNARFTTSGLSFAVGSSAGTITMGSGNITMGSGTLALGNTGTVSSSVNGLTGTSAGPVLNANSGSTVRNTIAGTTVTTVSNTLVTATVPLRSVGSWQGGALGICSPPIEIPRGSINVWSVVSLSSPSPIQTTINLAGTPGGYVSQFSDSTGTNVGGNIYQIDDLIPIDVSRCYEGEVWARLSSGTSGQVFVGCYCYDSAGTNLGSKWFIAGNSVTGTAQVFRGTIGGNGPAGTSATWFIAGTTHIRIVIYLICSGVWTVQIGAVRIREISHQCSAHGTAVTATANNTWTSVALAGETIDTSLMHDLVTNNSRITIPRAGNYRIHGFAEFAANSTGQRQMRIAVNGAASAVAGTTRNANAAASGITQMAIQRMLALSAGDYVELQVWQSSGGSLDIAIGAFLEIVAN